MISTLDSTDDLETWRCLEMFKSTALSDRPAQSFLDFTLIKHIDPLSAVKQALLCRHQESVIVMIIIIVMIISKDLSLTKFWK